MDIVTSTYSASKKQQITTLHQGRKFTNFCSDMEINIKERGQ